MQVGHKCPLDGTNRTFDYCVKQLHDYYVLSRRTTFMQWGTE